VVGSAAGDWVSSVATDDTTLDIVAVGTFQGFGDFDITSSVYALGSHGDSDAFVMRYTSNGIPIWGFSLGGVGTDEGNGVAISSAGHVFVTGYFSGSVDFDPSAGSFVLTTLSGANEAFLAEYDAAGHFVWADHLQSSSVSDGISVAIGHDGGIAWGGSFSGTISGALQGTGSRSSAGLFDAFVALYDSGRHLKFFRTLGSTGSDNYTRGVAIAPDGSVAAVGELNRPVTLATGVSITPAGGYDGFVTRLLASGAFAFAEALGGTLDDVANGVAIDSATGNVLVAATFQEAAHFPVPSGFTRTSHGSSDAALASFSPTGAPVWVRAFGGASDDGALGISSRGGLLTAGGYFSGSVDFASSFPSFVLTSSGLGMFAGQWNTAGTFVYAVGSNGTGSAAARSVSLDASNSSVIGGLLSGTESMAPRTLTSRGSDGFLVRRRP
jgi:hypothetical protein